MTQMLRDAINGPEWRTEHWEVVYRVGWPLRGVAQANAFRGFPEGTALCKGVAYRRVPCESVARVYLAVREGGWDVVARCPDGTARVFRVHATADFEALLPPGGTLRRLPTWPEVNPCKPGEGEDTAGDQASGETSPERPSTKPGFEGNGDAWNANDGGGDV